MKFLADENISHQTIQFLRNLGYDIKPIPNYLKGASDKNIITYASTEDRYLISLDIDFGKIYYFSERKDIGIIILRVHPPTVEHINALLDRFLKTTNLEKMGKCLIILEEKKYRIIK